MKTHLSLIRENLWSYLIRKIDKKSENNQNFYPYKKYQKSEKRLLSLSIHFLPFE